MTVISSERLLIIGHYTGDFEEGKENNRLNELFSRFQSVKHISCEVLTSSFSHKWKSQKNKLNIPENVTFVSEPSYYKNISLRRLYCHLVFSYRLFRTLNNDVAKPHIIYVAFPTPFVLFAVTKYIEFRDIKLIVDIQDIWPEAFYFALPRKLRRFGKALFSPFHLLNKICFSKVDALISVSETYLTEYKKYVKKEISSHVCYLGTSLSYFDASITGNTLSGSYLLNMCYVGKLSHSYDLETAINAIKSLSEDLSVGFHIFGTGPLEDKFRYMASGATNIHFYGNLDYKDLPGALRLCDVALNTIVRGAAQSITNKHADYAAAGLAVINTQENEEYKALVTEYGFGINAPPGEPTEVKKAIEKLYAEPQLVRSLKKKSRLFAEERMNRDATYPVLAEFIISQ
ncbi:glycosyltransferase family 4 protein [Paracoccaceae bacterium]|nr:glycosyltransferase family 4 protein [Paracoccaceae bacterium]